ncbi:hypothetical protein C8D87_1011656 [Lentzea atacamensis]|uniref:ABC-2 type transport system permease protein n=1 Tax=Lentzea atacamensis TaxID=531938 RepID=A0ABX9EJG4_9PSEU|nr:hypothetical protein [Lentzea atacamensis]RAS71355.1 hypothetical protein C8D87_1011656 [Lentzea atacamensis]
MKIFRHLTVALVSYGGIVGASVFLAVLAVEFGISLFGDVVFSGWMLVTVQIARWFVLWVGVYTIHNVLPIAIAHGRTRREFLGAATGFTVVFALAMTLLAWLGFLVEDGLYSLMDWRSTPHGSPLAYFLMFLVWCAVGMLVTAAFDRWGYGGVFTLPVGLALAVVPGITMPGTGDTPFVRNMPHLLGDGWHAVSLGAWVVAMAVTWAIARDLPVRLRTS